MKPVLFMAITAILAASCTKQLDNGSVSQSTADDAVLSSYSVVLPVSYEDVNPCNLESITVEGEFVLKGKFTISGSKLHFHGTQKFRQMRAIGLTTGWKYTLSLNENEHETIDLLLENDNPEQTYTIKGRATLRSPSNSSYTSSYTIKFTVDLLTYETVVYRADFVSECK